MTDYLSNQKDDNISGRLSIKMIIECGKTILYSIKVPSGLPMLVKMHEVKFDSGFEMLSFIYLFILFKVLG